MKSGLVISLASALVLAIPAPPSHDINLDERIRFGWCRETNVTSTCNERFLDHATCYNFEVLDNYLNDNIETVTTTGGRCVIWEKNGCHGDHTGMIVGTDIAVDNVCPGYTWSIHGSSVKCCGGDSNAEWCADPGEKPKCTD
ncbi:hypothetical protein G7Z17_g4193 [Cylindrodendrum hubeiense]|uniref:Uncharacterized protein n=1 Tax=Cylindrodendrum hubeiense TaxID=595255 RepID=A0A9P5HD82_9HYPO|nr:hypothetical protein G7Z17_g4193 [Cylindrodendrum hubeiense]